MAEICGANLDQSSSLITRDFKNIVELGVLCPISKLNTVEQDGCKLKPNVSRNQTMKGSKMTNKKNLKSEPTYEPEPILVSRNRSTK